MPRFQDIPQFTVANYQVDIPWDHIEGWLSGHARSGEDVDLEPDFQRAHVWTPEQQTAFVEFTLRGGTSAQNIYWNAPHWPRGNGPVTIVDGKQRITAVRAFLANDVPAFGHLHREYEDRLDILVARFRFYINDLVSRAEVLQWYLDLNYAGTPHTDDERRRVEELLAREGKREKRGGK